MTAVHFQALTGTLTAAEAEMLEAATALVPTLRDRRAETNDLRSLPAATVADIRDLGMLGVATPVELGGTDFGVDFLFELVMTLGRGCGSTAWCAGNWAIHNLFVAMFPEQARRDVFADADKLPIVSTGFSPLRVSARSAEGGAILDGQWDFASGVGHADWIVLVGVTEDGPFGMLVPTSEVELIDTWHTTGLRGSGSCDVAVSELFVPEARMLSMIGATEGMTPARGVFGGPFIKLPLGGYFGVGVIGSILGMAVGALEVFTERTSQNIGGLSGVKAGTRPEIHHKLGESAAEIETAVTLIRAMYAEQRVIGELDLAITMKDRLRWRRDQAYAAKLALQGTQRLFQAGGAHVLWSDDQLNQFHNDITAASHHFGMAWSTVFPGYGRFMLGLEHDVLMA